MTKKSSLIAALNATNKKIATPPTPITPGKVAEAPKAIIPYSRPARDGKKSVFGYYDPAVSRQLKQMALDQDTTVQELLREAINDLFVKHKQNPIA